MEIEQLEKRLEWLDEERRKDKTTIATLEDKITRLEGMIDALRKEQRTNQTEMSQFNGIYGRLDQVDIEISKLRIENGKMIDTVQKAKVDSDFEQEAKRRQETESINKSIQEVRKPIDQIPEIKKTIKQIQDEQKKLFERIAPYDQKIQSAQVGYEEFQRSRKLIDDARKVDAKRVTDLQGEVSAYRKRIDEQRARIDVLIENLKKAEARITEISQSEAERRQNQVGFIDKQNQQQVERDRRWREIESKFAVVEQAASGIESHLSTSDEMIRSVKKTKEQLDESTQRIDRRVNEITEMHRLNEDHFRLEWTSYKADDHKRWANYNLVQEETQKEVQHQFERMEDRLVQLEDLTQQVSDHFEEMNEETQNRLRALLNMAHGWVSSYERTFGKLNNADE
jgi:chromosome segregation ATPase